MLNEVVLWESRLMKTGLAAFFLAILAVPAYASDFCAGFEAGYITGHKQASGKSLDPLTPLCPLQPLKKMNDPDSDFEHGYVIGMFEGMSKGSR